MDSHTGALALQHRRRWRDRNAGRCFGCTRRLYIGYCDGEFTISPYFHKNLPYELPASFQPVTTVGI